MATDVARACDVALDAKTIERTERDGGANAPSGWGVETCPSGDVVVDEVDTTSKNATSTTRDETLPSSRAARARGSSRNVPGRARLGW